MIFVIVVLQRFYFLSVELAFRYGTLFSKSRIFLVGLNKVLTFFTAPDLTAFLVLKSPELTQLESC